MAIAEVRSIWKRFNGRAVVQDVSFTVEPGEILGMVGPNGAGKTTAIRMLLDILQPDEGSVLLFGQPFAGEHRPLLGYLPEERGLYRDLRVQETLEYLGVLKRMHRAEARRRGVAIVLSTHQMNQVEELCDRVLMINQGRVVLYGSLEEVRSGFGEGSILVEASGLLEDLPGVQKINNHGTYQELVMSDGSSSNAVFRALAEREIEVRRFEVATLPLEEIFVRIVRDEQ